MSNLSKLHEVINTKRDPKEVIKLEKKKVSPSQKEFMDMAETFKGMKTGEEIDYKCKLCKDKGFIVSDSSDYFIEDTLSKVVDGVIVDIPVYLKKCKCRIDKEFEINMNRSGMNAILDKIKNEKYETKYDWQKSYYNQMKDFVKNDERGLIMSGQTGSGKTLLMGKALLNLIHLGREAYYFDWRNDYSKKLVNQYNKQDPQHRKLMDYLCNVDVLYIDDLLKTRDNNKDDLYKNIAQIEIADEIIARRCEMKGKKTIITMEWYPQEIENLDDSLHGRFLQLLDYNNDNWIYMSKKENRNIRVKKFNKEF